jgi:adenosine phosphosulfate reductase beta subunit
MPSFVISEKCDGCKGGDKTACMYICPNDLMVLEPNEMKPTIRSQTSVGNVFRVSKSQRSGH